jgi:hypothetical protein
MCVPCFRWQTGIRVHVTQTPESVERVETPDYRYPSPVVQVLGVVDGTFRTGCGQRCVTLPCTCMWTPSITTAVETWTWASKRPAWFANHESFIYDERATTYLGPAASRE